MEEKTTFGSGHVKVICDSVSSYCAINNITRVIFDIPNEIIEEYEDDTLVDRIKLAMAYFVSCKQAE